jgi:hypothetical protein
MLWITELTIMLNHPNHPNLGGNEHSQAGEGASMKVVILILLIVGLLYALSFVIGSKSGPGDQNDLAHIPSFAGLKSLADRFGPGFDFNSVNDPHASAAQRMFTVRPLQKAIIDIAGNSEKKAQRLRIASARGICRLSYTDRFKPSDGPAPDPAEFDCQSDKAVAITDQGGTLQIFCLGPQECAIKIK